MATTQSTKPGDITGSSVLTGRTPSYRLVLKVDPQTGQYKYEYEVDDKPKAIDAVAAVPTPASGTGGDSKAQKPKGEEGSDKDAKKDPVSSFEQTRKMLSGSPEDRGSYRDRVGPTAEEQGYGYSGIPGKGGSGTFRDPKFGATGDTFTPGPGIGKAYDEYGRLRDIGVMKDIGLNLYDKAYPVATKAKDFISTGGIVGAIKGVADSLTGKKDTSKTTPGQGAPSDIPAENRFKSFEETREALGSTADLGSTRGLFSDLTAAREDIDKQIAQLEDDNKSPFAPRTFNENKIKELEKQKEALDPTGQVKSTDTRRPDALDTPIASRVADNRATISNARQNLESAIQSKNVGAAVDAAKTAAGFSGMSRDAAQREMDKAANNASSYGNAKTGTDKRGVENIGRNEDGTAQKGSIAAERDAIGKQKAEPGRNVNRDSATGNKARSNEVSDKNGNAVTDGKGKAVNFGGNKKGKDNDGGKGECFLAGTMISMADGSKKEVEKIDLGDVVEVGGKVFATGKFLTEDLHDYKGIKVSGSHMVNENNKWIRVADSKYSKAVDNDEHTVYVFGSENRRIVIDDILFTDYFEVYEQEKLIENENDFFNNWHAYGINRSQENVKVINAG